MSESRPRRDIHERIPGLAEQHVLEQTIEGEDPDLKFAGHGGDHVVFKIKQKEGREGKYRSIVAKASMRYIRRGFELWIREQKRIAPGESSQDAVQTSASFVEEKKERNKKAMEDELESEKRFFAHVNKFFPKESILNSRAKIQNVDIGPKIATEILQELGYEDSVSGDVIDVETVVRYQKLLPEELELGKEGVSSFGMIYLERMNISFEDYVRLNNQTLLDTEDVDTKLFFKCLHGTTAELLIEAREDEELKNVLQDLVGKIIDFTNSSGQMLDIAGQGNMRVYKDKNGKWGYLMMDVYAGGDWSLTVEAAQELVNVHSSLPPETVSDLANGLNYARTINGMASVLGVKKRIKLLDAQKTYESTVRVFSRATLQIIQGAFNWPDRKAFPESESKDFEPVSLEPTVKLPPKKKA
jgi:hypothetical protein